MGTISDKLLSISSSKSDFKEILQYANLDITDDTTFREYAEGVFNAYINILNNPNDLFNVLPKNAAAAGTSLNISETIAAPMQITLNPSTLEQETTTGKNLCFNADYESANTARFRIDKTNLQKTITLSYISDVTSSNGTIYLFTDGTNRGWLSVTIEQVANTRKYVNITFNDTVWNYIQEATYVWLTSYAANAGHVASTAVKEGQIENGSIMTNYEPYTGSIPAPNPSYPQTIHTISGDNSITICGKNLFDDSEKSNTWVALDGSISSIDEANIIKYKCQSGDTFYLNATFDDPNSNSIIVIAFYDSDDNLLNRYVNLNQTSLSLNKTAPNNTAYMYAGHYSIIPTTIMLSTENIDFEPYQEQTAQLNLGVENLFDNTISTAASNCTKSNGIFTTSALDDWNLFIIGLGKNISIKEGEIFYISYDIKLNSGDTKNLNYFGRLANNDNSGLTDFGELVGTFSISDKYQRAIWKTTATSNFTATRMLVQASSVVNNQTFSLKNIQISKQLGSYTEYGETPIEYCKIGNYEDKFIRTSGKNLLDISKVVKGRLDSGVVGYESNTTALTYTDTSFSFTTNANYRGCVSDYIDVNNATNLTYSTTTIRTGITNNMSCYDKNKTYLGNATVSYSGDYIVKYTLLSNTKFVRIEFNLNSLGTITIQNFQLELGSSATDYEPYGNGAWYIKKNIGKVVLDGSETWNSNQSTENEIRFNSGVLLNRRTGVNNTGYCNYFQVRAESYHEGISIYKNDNSAYIWVSKSIASTTAEFNTWLSNNNVILYYILETPTYTPITGTLASQLDNLYNLQLKSYDSITNVSQTNNDLPFIMNCITLQDLE